MPSVVLLKSFDGPDKYVEILSRNFKVIPIATLEFSSKNLKQLNVMLHNPNKYAGIIFTSPRSISTVKEALAGDTLSIKEWSILDNYSIGEASHSLAKNLLSLETKGHNAGNASNLADFIAEDQQNKLKNKPFLFPCGNLKQDTLQLKLSEFKIYLDCIEVYETVPHRDLVTQLESCLSQRVDILIYFSPSGVNFTIDVLRKNSSQLNDIKFVAIGPSTKKALEDHTIKIFKTCPKPSPESLLEVLLE